MKSKILLSLTYVLLVLSFSGQLRADRDADRRNERIPPGHTMHPPRHDLITPFSSSSPVGNGYTPQQLQHAYGFDQLNTTGAGQVIAIVDAYGSPTIQADLNTFCAAFGLPSTTVQIYFPQGSPPVDPGFPNWATETSLDVEWAHAIAPGATIVLIASKSNATTDLFAAVDYAASIGASQVSMSWGGSEFSTEGGSDFHFHVAGMAFFAASGDNGAGATYPASSPFVVGVGGTTLALDSSFNITSETAWSGSGGGASIYEAVPGYQAGWWSGTATRGVPDVAYDADPATGVPVYLTGFGWRQFGGTSMSAPQWAALFALANSLSAQSLSPAPGVLYSLANTNYAGYYRDIISGNDGANLAGPGYDLVTGLGSPLGNQLVIALAGGFSSQAAAPVFFPAAGAYSSAQNVTIVSATPGVSIRYTTDGSMPTETTGTIYSGPVTISSNTTLEAIAYESGLADSPVSSGTYTFLPQTAAPVFSPAAAIYTTVQNVTISTITSGASIRYTTDGSTPTETNGTPYTGPVNISTTTTLKAIAYESGFTDSAITSGTYIFPQAAAPVFSPAPGNYSSALSVTMTSTTSGASIRYTTNGGAPTETVGTLYSGPVNISPPTTLRAIAYKSGFADSAITSGTYTFQLPPTITSFTPTTIGEGMAVTITGTNFSSVSSVKFNGVAASFAVNSSTQITATTPLLALTNGPITVTTPFGTATSPTSFTFTLAPIITGFTPASGPVNRILVVNGSNFAGTNITLTGILFNGVEDTAPYSFTNTKLTLIVPAGATSGPITVQTSQGTATSTTSFIVAAGSPPANDNFANAQILTGASGGVLGNTANATKEPGEPNHAGNPGGASVWFAWTAPSSGLYLFNPLGSDFGMLLGIYTGTSVNALTQVSSGSPNGRQTATGVSLDVFSNFVNGTVLNAVAGTTYHIAIDGYNGLMGDYVLLWSPLAAPTITTFIASASPGQTINILGTGFVPATAVEIGGVTVSPANVTATSSTSVQVVVPANVVTGPITVTTPAGTATSSTNITVTAAPVPTLTSFSPTSGNPGPSIRYTTDGSTPSEAAGTLYSGPVSISSTTTLQAITYAGGYTDSLVASGTYNIGSQPQVAAPVFSPGGGSYTSGQIVTISTATSGAIIRYTTDGSTPSETNGTAYSGAVSIGSTTNLQAIAYESGFADSTVTSAYYVISSAGSCVTAIAGGSWQDSPMTSSLSGTFTASFDATPSASPTNAVVGLSNGAQTAYSGNACSVRFNDLGTIDARNGGAYQAASVIPFSLGTTYHFRLDVNVSNHTYSIFVTPSGGSEIQVGSNYAFRNEQNAVTSLNYWNVFNDALFSGGVGSLTACNFTTIATPPQAGTPSFSPAPGTYSSAQSVSISTTTSGASISIVGTHLLGTTAVLFNGSNATFTVVSDTLVTAAVPAGATSGLISVITPSGTAVSTGIFTVNLPPLAPVFSPAGGTFTSAQSVAITSSGATAIYYTTDGSPPTTSSMPYTAPISIANNTVLQAIGVNSGGTSPVASVAFTILPPAPAFSPAPGTYANVTTFSVAISDAASATIYYTTDGSTPTTSSAQYTGAVVLPIGTTTLNAIAVTANGSSDVTTGTYVLTPPPPLGPVFNPVGGTFTSAQSVAITSSGATAIYYTTDGSTPTTSSTPYTAPISIANNTVLEAIGANSGGNSSTASASYTILPPPPTFDPAPGAYANVTSFSVVISDAASATIYYTTDGSTPTTSSAQYTGAVVLPIGTITLNAIAVTANGSSDITTGTYILTPPPPAAPPVFSPVPGTYVNAQNVTMTSATSGASIRYTTDGSTPTETSGTLYFGPVNIPTSTMLKAIAYEIGFADSMTTNGTYTITRVAAPVFSPAAGTYTSVQNVTITSATSGASIRYTTDGSRPTKTHGTLYSGPVNIPTSTKLKAIAYKTGLTDSPVARGKYAIHLPTAAAPTFSPATGAYSSVQNVTITSATSGVVIRYTTDGSTPTETHGTIYSTSVTISKTTTLKAIAYENGFINSPVTTGKYTIH
jgi:Chitobiase/beta-hexosaminidase C-terminal domain/Fn3 associated